MKKIFSKNQIIITALALLIALAGYLNYTGKNAMKNAEGDKSIKNEGVESENGVQMTDDGIEDVSTDAENDFNSNGIEAQIGDIDSLDEDLGVNAEVLDDASGENGDDEKNASDEVMNNDEKNNIKDEGEDKSAEDEGENTNDGEEETMEPGATVFTNSSSFSANARLSREQVRSQNKETLLNALDTGTLSEEQKQQLTDEMIKITKHAEMENEIETILDAKGYEEAVVSISDSGAEVVINTAEIDDAKRAMIEDIVKRKTSFNIENIVITPIN